MSEPQPKPFPSVPAIGSDKQDGFARSLAVKLSLSLPALEAILKTETGRDPLPVFPHYYSKQEGGKIIDHLLAKCKLAGIEIKTRGSKPRRGRGEPQPEPQPGGGAKTLAQFSAVELNNELQSRGVRQLAGVDSELLMSELRGRGKFVGSVVEALGKAELNTLAAELERRGYPGEAMKANPDLLGQAAEMGRLLLEIHHSGWLASGMIRHDVKAALLNSGLLAE